MAYENVNFTYPNFCIGPQDGTYCSINQNAATTILQIKNESGGTIADYTFSSSLLYDVKGIEYVGPINLTGILDDLTFFTLERINANKCMIKRFETKTSSSQLALKKKIVKSTTGSYHYDASGMSIEHYRREFGAHNAGGTNTLVIDDASRLSVGDILFLGPSTDSDNEDATESVTVNTIVGTTVTLDTNIVYQYVSGDPITFFNNIYLISDKNIGGGYAKGTVFQLDAYTGAYKSATNDGLYNNVEASKWYEPAESISLVRATNLLFVQPYVSYQRWRSQSMNNVESNKSTIIPVEDIVFEGTAFYKLMGKVTKRDDNGNLTTTNWTNYNFQLDSIAPYSNAIRLFSGKNFLVGPSQSTTIYAKLIDQFGIGLGSKTLTFDVTGDSGAFTPITGIATTDSNGDASIIYTSDAVESPSLIEISAYAIGGFPANGSSYVWGFMNLDDSVEVDNEGYLYQTASGVEGSIGSVKQVEDEKQISMKLFGKTFFTSPGGDWINPSIYNGEVATYIPGLVIGDDDGPTRSFDGGGGTPVLGAGEMPNRITQILDFESEGRVYQDDGFSAEGRIATISGVIGGLQISQLKLSLHTYWVGITAYDELFTETTLNQFIFVDEAIPPFWSEKNSKDTYIWIRLRPYASDLEQSTVKFSVREVSYAGDTGYVDYTSSLVITPFLDISGNLGLELYLQPPQDFHHNAIVYVHIEVDDALGNHIWVDYYFYIIPDYRFPYLDNLNPDREDALVPVDSDIYFEIKDEGVGIDIDSLELYVNSRYTLPTNVEKVSDHHYKVTYSPSSNFYYDKSVQVQVMVRDASDNENWMNDSYRFYTVESDDVWFTGFQPGVCKRGINPDSIISFLALGGGSGVDRDTIVVQIQGHDVTDDSSIVPVIYRIS